MMWPESWNEAVSVIAKHIRDLERTIYELRHENEKLRGLVSKVDTIPAPHSEDPAE